MRLTALELSAIQSAFLKANALSQGRLFLFGSRTDDSRRGGDIDLLIVVPGETDKNKFMKLDFLVEVKKAIGERKIDVTLASVSETQTDAFLSLALASAILLVE
jgi:hypothetical protein